jgi:putative PIN family toxin of toxin-antitoxin system
MRIVLDTNIVLDLLHFRDRDAAPLERALNEGDCYTDDDCLAELARVLAYPEFSLDAARQAAHLDDYRRRARLSNAEGPENYALPRCRDTDDQKFLVLAARCRADLLVTRDRLLLRIGHFATGAQRCRIVTAQDAATLL